MPRTEATDQTAKPAAAAEPALALANAINESCPWSGKPIQADSLTRYRGEVVGFCNPGCRDKFATAAALFDRVIDSAPGESE